MMCEYTIGPDYDSMSDDVFADYMRVELRDILDAVENKECEIDIVVKWTFELADKIFKRKHFLMREHAK